MLVNKIYFSREDMVTSTYVSVFMTNRKDSLGKRYPAILIKYHGIWISHYWQYSKDIVCACRQRGPKQHSQNTSWLLYDAIIPDRMLWVQHLSRSRCCILAGKTLYSDVSARCLRTTSKCSCKTAFKRCEFIQSIRVSLSLPCDWRITKHETLNHIMLLIKEN